jgi:hypothetical protein
MNMTSFNPINTAHASTILTIPTTNAKMPKARLIRLFDERLTLRELSAVERSGGIAGESVWKVQYKQGCRFQDGCTLFRVLL